MQTLKVFKRTQVARDDLLDACVLAWTAYRIATAQAQRVPDHPQEDSRGLRMEIWY
jgi:predicted RNase H-like nuclease